MIVKIRLQFMKFSLYIIENLPIYVDIHKKFFQKMSTHDPQIMNSYHHKKFHSIFFFAHNSPQGDVMKVCKDIGRRCNFELYTYQHQYCKMPNLNGKLGRYHTDRYVGTSMKLCYALNSMKPLLITLACTVCTEKKSYSH